MAPTPIGNKFLILKLHGGLGDQLSMYFGALELAQFSRRQLILAKWSVDNSHIGSPYGLFELVPNDLPIEFEEQFFERKLVIIHQKISGYLRNKISEGNFFRSRIYLDRFAAVINNVKSYDYQLQELNYIYRELRFLKRRKRVKLDCYFPSFTTPTNLEISTYLPGLFPSKSMYLTGDYAIMHFRVGDIYDVYTERGLLDGSYYSDCINKIKKIDSKLPIYAVSDNIKRAKSIYGDLSVSWIEDSDNFTALEVLRVLTNSKVLVTANSGLSFWAGRLNPEIQKVFSPMFPTKAHLQNNRAVVPHGKNWVIMQNEFLG